MSDDKNKNPKERKINLSLQEVARQLEEMEASYTSQARPMPAPARKMEERIQALQEEMDEISDKMLAHKLKRLASSKMLEAIGEKKSALTAAGIVHSIPKKTESTDYQFSTFKCKSDLDQCLISSKNALDKALCFTLFIRCVIKG